MPPTRAGKHQHRGARGPSSNGGSVSARLCAPFDADIESPSMKMRSMPRGTLFTAAPFALVAALAAGIALAGFIAHPYPIADPTRANASTPPSPAPIAADATASPAASTAAPTKAAGSNDAVEMLRVHNELRAAIGAPAVRGDDRVTAAAQHHAEYLARAGMIGHDETAGEPGFTGASVRDRLAAQGYTDATASEVAASSDTGTEDVRFLCDLRSAKLTDASGRDITVSVVPQIYERDYVAVVPSAPLAAGASYRVRLELSVGGSDVVEEWEFETER